MAEPKINFSNTLITSKDIIFLCNQIIKTLKKDSLKDLSLVGFHVAYSGLKREVDLYPTVKDIEALTNFKRILNEQMKKNQDGKNNKKSINESERPGRL